MTQQSKTGRTYKVKNPYTVQPDKGKKFTQLSKTIPDQSLPLIVILERHTRGLPLDASMRIPLYEGENETQEGIDIKNLDLVDIEQMATENNATILENKNKLEYEKSEKLRKKYEADEAKKKADYFTEFEKQKADGNKLS